MGRDKPTSEEASPTIFSPFRLGPLHLKNRLVALPVFTGYAYPDGKVSPPLIEHYNLLAGSGVSLVVVANAAVTSDGVTSKYNLRVDQDEYIPGLAKLATTIKQQDALACLQLNHGGRFAKTDQPLLPSPADSSNLAFNVTALKDFMNFFPLEKRFELTRYFLKQANTWRRAMTADDRKRIIIKFAEASVRAYQAGFDLIELHSANGYLLCQFLSAFTNKISTDFGADFEKRTTFPLAVIREIKNRLPDGFPIGFRFILKEWVPGGIDLPESFAFAKLLKKEGISYLSASVGSYNSIFSPHIRTKLSRPAYLREEMAELKRRVNISTIMSGRIIHPTLANDLVREGVADLVGLGRSLRADINWIKKAAGKGQPILVCMNCNWCLKRVILEQGFNCRRWPKLIQQRADFDHECLNRNYKSLWVVADRSDLRHFNTSLPILLAEPLIRAAPIAPTVLFLQTEDQDRIFDSDRDNFINWSRKMVDRIGLSEKGVNYLEKSPNGEIEELVSKEIRRGNYGVVLIGFKNDQTWREHVLYKERRKVIGLLNANDHQSNILIPVDLSKTTLLVLKFVAQSYMGHTGFDLKFVYVSDGPKGSAEKRWNDLKKIIDFDANAQLHIVPSKGAIANNLIDIIKEGGYGTIIMGKRGFSGIKRWLLGSVSAGVLRKLTDQSLFLVD